MDYETFNVNFHNLTGIDLNLYKEKQMKRRIENYINWNKKVSYEEFWKVLANNSEQLNKFLDYITINVTEFFRTPDHWKYLEDEILPGMQSFNVWSCACSTGEEPYSIAMSLAEQTSLENIHILATDIDERVLSLARKGIYNEKAVSTVPQNYLEKYFEKTPDGYRVCEALRNCVEFKKLNLLADAFPTHVDLILCRNILIYFTSEAKSRVYESFHRSLKPGGILFTGNTEQILNYKDIGYQKVCKYIYYVKSEL